VDEEIDSTSPSLTAWAASSCELHLDKGTSRRSGGSQARALIPATTAEPKRRGRPDRGRSSKPASPSWQKRLRHFEATSTQTPHQRAMSTLRAPSAAKSTIWARTTLAWARVRDDARSSSTARSSAERDTSNGEERDISNLPGGYPTTGHQITPTYLSAEPLASRTTPNPSLAKDGDSEVSTAPDELPTWTRGFQRFRIIEPIPQILKSHISVCLNRMFSIWGQRVEATHM